MLFLHFRRTGRRLHRRSVTFRPADCIFERRCLPGIELRGNNHFSREARNAAVSHTRHQDVVMAPVRSIFMLVPVESPAYAERFRKPVYRGKALSVAGWGFVRHQNIRALTHQVLVDGREDCRSMTTRQPPAPHISQSHAPDKARRTEIIGRILRHPYLTAEHAAESGNSQPGHIRDAPVKIMGGQRAAPDVVVDRIRIRIMIARYPPDRRNAYGPCEDDLEGLRRLHIAQNDDRVRPMLKGSFVDVLEGTVRVAAKENLRQRFREAGSAMTTRTTPFSSDFFCCH